MDIEDFVKKSIIKDKFGVEISREKWCELLEEGGYSKIADAHIGQYYVSTIWLGFPHNLAGNSEYFETMVFKDRECIYLERYNTLEETLEGFKKTCKKFEEKEQL